MDKPASKAELLKSIKEERKKLENSLKGLSVDQMLKPPAPGEWSVQDILAHVSAWEMKFMGWYEAWTRGEKITMPDWSKPGLVDEINQDIYKRNHDRWLKEVQKEFKESHKRIRKTIKSIDEETIFISGKVEWTGKNTLLDYIWSNTGRHYAEHAAMIEAIRQKYGM